MNNQQPNEISVQKSAPLWKRLVKRPSNVNVGDLLLALSKGGISIAATKPEEVAKSGVDVLEALGLDPRKVEGIAWLLVQRSLVQAMVELTTDYRDTLPAQEKPGFKPELKSLGEYVDQALQDCELSVTADFFEQAKRLPILERIYEPFRLWLKSYGVPGESAEAVANRLPSYFLLALNEEWKARPQVYGALQQEFETPFAAVVERQGAWTRYRAWLQKQVDQPMFAEAFSLRQVYIPLRGYYERSVKKIENFSRKEWQIERVVVDLHENLNQWVERADKDDALRVICGGPGCGKSSLTKMFASSLAEREQIPVLFIPLHLFNESGDLMDSLNLFIDEDLDEILPPNPLAKDTKEERVLLIFDGLDELAMQGKIAVQVAQEFVEEVKSKLTRFNQSHTRLMVLLSGRSMVVQGNRAKFRKEGQLLHVLPYFSSKEELKKHQYVDNAVLLIDDQREEWWQTYGMLKGKEYTGIPHVLERDKLPELTVQPLLNYLMAFSYDQGRLDFSTDSNLNAIYAALLEEVYERDWADIPYPALDGKVTLDDFIRILEEIAIACWHGNGRTATVKQIEARCTSGRLKKVLSAFKGGAREGVTRLLTAFYFRQNGLESNEATFEFTHRSFGEYLAARRMVRELDRIQSKLTQHRESYDDGWSEKECLKRWVVICGPAELDLHMVTCLQNEVSLVASTSSLEKVQAWQKTLCKLISLMLRQGMPMDELSPRPSFQEEKRQGRNGEEALLAVLSACALTTKQQSPIHWPSSTAARAWLISLQGESIGESNPVGFRCMNYLDLSEQDLRYIDLTKASLENANLDRARLDRVRLVRARLVGASFAETILVGARLVGAILDRANLNQAILDRTILDRARLDQAILSRARLDGAHLDGAILDRANLNGASFDGAILDWARLDEANLVEATLNGASINGTSFDKANIDRASMKDVSWDVYTQWNGVQGVQTAKNIPSDLRQQILLQSRLNDKE